MSQERLTALVLELRQQRVVNMPMPYVKPAWQRFYEQQQPWAPPSIVTCKGSESN